MRSIRYAVMIAAAAAFLKAQTPPKAADDAQPTFKVGSEEVVLDVVVRDKKGRMINDLKPQDFQVVDSGETRTIKNFRRVDGTEAVSSGGKRSQLDPLRQVRLLTLIFQGMDQNGNKLAREASTALFKSELGPNVYMSVVAIDRKLQVIQPFTNNLELLRKAVERATSGANDFTSDTAHVRAQLEQILGPNQGGGQSAADRIAGLSNGSTSASGPGSAPSGAAANAAMAQMMLQIANSNQEDSSTDWGRTIIMALLTAVKEQYLLPGRKTILYFSEGFTIPQGMETAFNSVISVANRASVSFYPVDARGLTIYSTNQAAADGLNSAGAAARNNAINASKGVSTEMAHSDDARIEGARADSQDALGQLAKKTGGDFIANSNDFKGRVKRLNEDIQSYYEISYDPQIQKYDGSFRTVAVKLSQPDLRVQSRLGYFALPPSTSPNSTASAQTPVLAAYEVPLLKALDEKLDSHPFPFHSEAMHFQGEAGTPTCDVVIDVPLAGLTFRDNKSAGQMDVRFAYVALVKNARGEVVRKFHNEIPIKVTPDQLSARKASHYIKAEPFDLPAGQYSLETAVLDGEGNKVSTQRTGFTIPQQNATLGLSSIAIVRSTNPKTATTKANDPLLMEDKVVSPVLSPVIKKSETAGLPLYVIIYSNKSNTDKPALSLEFTKDGQALGSFPAPVGAADTRGRISDVVTVPVASLPTGAYMVKFTAKQGAEAVTESVSFTLEP